MSSADHSGHTVHSGAFALGLPDWPEGTPPRYRQERLLGRGGMGEVWQAWDEQLRRYVALKRVRPGSSPDVAARLIREARITAALEHPGIVPVHDAGIDEDGQPWYAMRVVRGRTLAHTLAEASAVERPRLLRHVLAACEAMAFAHEHGVVHRDLKPDNLQLGAWGETQVMDWGLARPLDRDDGWDEILSEIATMTQAGMVLGTPAYMSPEQAAGEPSGTASDVWSLGIVLYEVASGTRAYTATSSQEALRQVLAGAPPALSSIDPSLAPELCAIVDRALQVDPADRYPDAGAMAADLEAFLDGRRVGAHKYSAWDEVRRRTHQWRWPLRAAGTGMLGVGIAAAIGLWSWYGAYQDLQQARTDLEASAAEASARLAESWTQRALLAFESGDRARAQLLAARALALSDDLDARGIIADPSGHPKRMYAEPTPGCHDAAFADGTLVCIREDGVHVLPVEGPDRVLTRGEVRGVITQPWSSTVLVASPEAAKGAGLHVLDLQGDGSPPRYQETYLLAEAGPSLVPGSWSSTGSIKVRSFGQPFARQVGQHTVSYVDATPCAAQERPRQPVLISPEELLLWCDGAGINRVVRGPPAGPFETFLEIPEDRLVDDVAVDVTGEHVAFGEIAGRFWVLDLRTREIVLDQQLGPSRVRRVELSADSRWAAAQVPGQGLSVFHVPTGRRHRIPTSARSFSFDRSDRLHVWDGQRHDVWAMPAVQAFDPRHIRDASGGLAPGIVSVSWGEHGIAIATGTGAARFTPDDDQIVHTVMDPALITKAALARPGGALHVGSLGGHVVVGEDGQYQTVHPRAARRLLPMAGDRMLALGQPTRVLAADGTAEIEEHLFAGVEAGVSPDGMHAAMLDEDGNLKRLSLGVDAISWDHLGLVQAKSVVVGSGGWPVYLGTPDGIEILDASLSTTRFATTGAWVLDLAISPDGSLIAATDEEQRIWVYRAEDGRPLARMRGHSRRVGSVAFSPDGRWLVSGSWDASVRFWDMERVAAPADTLLGRVEEQWGMSAEELFDAERAPAATPP